MMNNDRAYRKPLFMASLTALAAGLLAIAPASAAAPERGVSSSRLTAEGHFVPSGEEAAARSCPEDQQKAESLILEGADEDRHQTHIVLCAKGRKDARALLNQKLVEALRASRARVEDDGKLPQARRTVILGLFDDEIARIEAGGDTRIAYLREAPVVVLAAGGEGVDAPVCRKIRKTTSRVDFHEVCMTQAEWDRQWREGRKAGEEALSYRQLPERGQ